MAIKLEIDETIISEESIDVVDSDSLDFCSDCLYDWCTNRSAITFCTMKVKGLFECKSCILKLLKEKS